MQLDLNNIFRRYSIIIILIFSVGVAVNAQQLKPRGEFLQDSFKLGKPVPYSLSFRYPSEMNVIFPDTTFNFSPFELSYRDYFYTQSDSATSFDSVVYYLRTFELDTVQKLTLPVFVVKQNDSTAIYASLDSLIFKQVVPVLPDSVNLKETSYFQDVETDFNYPYAIAILVAVIAIAVILLILFGDKVRRGFRLRKLKKEHNQYLAKYNALLERSNGEGKNKSEELLITWKNYLEKLEKAPYTKQTSKEIFTKHPELKEALRSIDKDIYANVKADDLDRQYKNLLDYSINSYRYKIEAIKNGN
jgi:hypothetical protein